jgi:protein CpxP
MKAIILALASTFIISSAYAETSPPITGAQSPAGVPTTKMDRSDARRDAQVDTRIKDLHTKLKITAEQEGRWANVGKAMHKGAIELDKAIEKREGMVKTASAIDNLNAYGDIAQAHLDSIKELSSAFSPLYASMPDEQKALADEVFSHRKHEKRKETK